MGFCLGNAIKYIWRDGQKTGEDVNDDLRKAIWYIQREIDRRIDEQKLVDECNTTDWSVRAEKPTEAPQADVAPDHHLDYVKKKAMEGDAEAQWILGNAYLFGRGVEKDKAAAERLWKLAEQNRKAEADRLWKLSQQNRKYSDLVTKSVSSPNLTGTTLAYAQAGDANRQYQMGVMCYYGDGVPQDYEAAVGWWHKAAEQGNYEAQLSLVNAYRIGTGVPKDEKAANYWLEQANSQRTDKEAQ
jgi:TPR repeat protein